jgi:hypothetical protein
VILFDTHAAIWFAVDEGLGKRSQRMADRALKRFPTDLNRWDSQKVRDERVFGH